MTKKSFNALLRIDPKHGTRPDGTVFAEHRRLRPLNLGRAALTHREKMTSKVHERALLASSWNQTPRAQQWLTVYGGYWRDIRRKHGVGRRPHYNNITELAA